MEDVVIIGGGPAGMAAAIYAARKNLKTVVLEKAYAGGQMAAINAIENYPGFPEPVSGMELSRKMEAQARKVGVKFEFVPAIRVEKRGDGFRVKTEKGDHDCRAVVIATGAKHRKLQVPGEEKLGGRGVSYCTTCDGPLFKGRTVAVVGGGNHAVMAALYLSEIAAKVYLCHRGEDLRADEVLVDRLKKSKIGILWDTVVKEVKGDKRLTEVVLENSKTKESTVLKVDGLFVAIGETPTAKIAEELGVRTNQNGFIIVDKTMNTNVPGVFACGDVTEGAYQIATAVGSGATAALSAYDHIKKLK